MRCLCTFAAFLISILIFMGPVGAQNTDPPPLETLEARLAEMNRWVGRGRNGSRWRAYLQSQDLQRQIDRGTDADPEAVRQVHEIFARDTPGLEKARFVAVRDALAVWLEELTPADIEELPERVQLAKQQFAPVTDEHVQQTKRALKSEINRLDQYMSRFTRQNRDGWRKYLAWEVLQQELNGDEAPNLGRLNKVLKKLERDQPGLELPVFMRVRNALRRFGYTASFARSGNKERLVAELDKLAKSVAEYTDQPNDESAVAIGTSMNWLHNARQSGGLLRDLRRSYARPNFYAQISSQLVSGSAAEEIEETRQVYENIMGLSVSANATTQGQVSARLVPNSQRATLEFVLNATTQSRNVGRRGPVTIYSRGNTSVLGTKRIWLNERGISGDAAVAKCRTKTQITGIGARHQLIRKVAQRQISQSKGQAESIASRRAERRVRNEMETRAQELLSDANEKYRTKFRNPMLRRDGFPRSVATRSDVDHLHIQVVQASRSQLAAHDTPPPLADGQDLGVQLHESWARNFSNAAISNYTLTDKKLADILIELTGKVSDDLRADPDNPWSITFAPRMAPVRMAFRDNQLKFAIRGTRFEQGERKIAKLMEISATYIVEQGEKTKLIRQGDVSVELVNQGQLNVAEVTLKSFFRKKFETMFKPEFESDGIELPGRLEKLGKLKLNQFVSSNGWLSLGWQLSPPVRTAKAPE